MNPKCLLIVFIIGLNACHNSGKEDKAPDFFSYSIDDLDAISVTPFDGIVHYFVFNDKDGLSHFYLIPKNAEWYSQQFSSMQGKNNAEKEELLLLSLSKKSFRQLSEDFTIYVSHVGRKYWKAAPEQDFPYTPIIPRTDYMYELDFDKNIVIKIDSQNIKTEQDVYKQRDLIYAFIKAKLPLVQEDSINKILIQFYPSFERASLILLDFSENQQILQRIGHKEYPNVSLNSPKSMAFTLDSLSYSYLKDSISFGQEDFVDRQDFVEDGISHSILYTFKSGRIEDVDLRNSLTENQYKLIIKLIDLNIAHSTDKMTTNYLKGLKGYHGKPN